MAVRWLWNLGFLLLLLAPGLAQGHEHVRLVRDDQGRMVILQTAITSWKAPSGQTVDLISAVHLGEKSYYRRLMKTFANYDVVLYELILDGEPPEDGKIELDSLG